MEFKYRAVDHRRPPHSASPSTIGYVGAQDMQDRYQSSKSGPISGERGCDLIRSIQLEIQSEQIRVEMISEKITKLKELEAVLRREIAMEKDIAMRKANEGMPFNERLAVRLDGFSLAPSSGHDFPRNASPQPQPQEHSGAKVSLSEPKKGKLIILRRPDPTCGTKRKAPTPSAATTSEVLKKKHPVEWSCALCNVTTTSEKLLKAHFQGKKHMANEDKLGAERTAKSPNSSKPKGTAKGFNFPQSALDKEQGVEIKYAQEPPEINGHEKNKFGDSPSKKTGALEKPNGVATQEIMQVISEVKYKRKPTYWCMICHIGTHSEVVMENHKKGRRHKEQLRRQIDRSEAVNTVSTLAPAAAATTMVPYLEPTKDIGAHNADAIADVTGTKAQS